MRWALVVWFAGASALASPRLLDEPPDPPFAPNGDRVERASAEFLFGGVLAFGAGSLAAATACQGRSWGTRDCVLATASFGGAGALAGVTLSGWAFGGDGTALGAAIGQAIGAAMGAVFMLSGAAAGYYLYLPMLAFPLAGAIAGFEWTSG